MECFTLQNTSLLLDQKISVPLHLSLTPHPHLGGTDIKKHFPLVRVKYFLLRYQCQARSTRDKRRILTQTTAQDPFVRFKIKISGENETNVPR